MKWCLDGDPSAAGVYGARPSVAPTCIGGKVNLATARPSLQYRRDQEIIAEEELVVDLNGDGVMGVLKPQWTNRRKARCRRVVHYLLHVRAQSLAEEQQA